MIDLAAEGHELLHAVAVRQARSQLAEASRQLQFAGPHVAAIAAVRGVQLPAQRAHDAAPGKRIAGRPDAGTGPHERRRRLRPGKAVSPGGAGAASALALVADSAVECARAGPAASAGARAGAALQRLEHLWPLIVVIPSTHCDGWRAARTREGETDSPTLQSAVSQQRPDNQGSMSCRDVVGRRCPASLVLRVEAPRLCLLVVVNCRLPSARVTGTKRAQLRRLVVGIRKSRAMSRMAMVEEKQSPLASGRFCD